MPSDLTPRASTKFFDNNETSNNGFRTIEPRLKAPYYYRFPHDMLNSNRVGSGGGVHTVRITAFASGSGGQVLSSNEITKGLGDLFGDAADAIDSQGNGAATTTAEGGGLFGGGSAPGTTFGTVASSGLGAQGSIAGGPFQSGGSVATTEMGGMEFIMTNSPENRMSAQWDGTDFGLLGAALEQYRKGASLEDALKSIANNPDDTAEYAIRKAIGALTTVKQLALGGTAPDTVAAASRRVENPFREQLFKTMNFRTFPMQFKLAPKSAGEAATLKSMLTELERNMHPEKDAAFLVYPSEFKVEFLYDGSPNDFLPTLNACVLTDMNVQYGHGGFMTSFANSRGTPTEVTLTLSFKEIFTRDRRHIEGGGGGGQGGFDN